MSQNYLNSCNYFHHKSHNFTNYEITIIFIIPNFPLLNFHNYFINLYLFIISISIHFPLFFNFILFILINLPIILLLLHRPHFLLANHLFIIFMFYNFKESYCQQFCLLNLFLNLYIILINLFQKMKAFLWKSTVLNPTNYFLNSFFLPFPIIWKAL